MFSWVCSVKDHRLRQNVPRTSDTPSCASSTTVLFLPHLNVICDLLLNRPTVTCNLFVLKKQKCCHGNIIYASVLQYIITKNQINVICKPFNLALEDLTYINIGRF